jgi:hypothetical protein
MSSKVLGTLQQEQITIYYVIEQIPNVYVMLPSKLNQIDPTRKNEIV